jgi:hypothetical protein
VTYETEIYELRRQIDRLDRVLLDKIYKLSKLIRNTSTYANYNPYTNLRIKQLTLDKNLDEKAVLRIFKEIKGLIEEQEVNL